ncbi:serine/threonine-protein kinase [Enemella evansiae]|uniref:serine/threonine-protein kinase n=1 Tax=Enemella evansiae TaxID=2016499 RepID=UPI001E435A28|nr:serine/threonine-protein kinase [Enemella evansiae]
MKCAQPGCTGTISDGYCDVCGMPPSVPAPAGSSRAAAPPPSPTPASAASASAQEATMASPPPSSRLNPVKGAPPAARATGRCRMPGCGGEIRDGYCDICGSPPDVAPAPVGDDAALSTVTRGSSRLGSTALGSRRAASSGSRATRRTGTGSMRMRGNRIGAGLTRVPPAPAVDPSAAIMKNPMIPESRRNCPSCGAPVGRSRDGRPGRTTGFCAKCRNPFSFDPKLQPGDLIAGQYEVAGCLAHGGLGWIYLARDRNVSNRWVVLKGLLNSGDADALAAAIAEQQFLAQVEHPLIVEIYNFVTHEGAGYIVMEYVGGRSLKQLLKDRMVANNGEYDPLPPDQAMAYLIEALPAFAYLHDMGLVYCDFKPDNIIQVGDAIKLIDLGGVRRVDDDESAIYGTIGYQAPEVARAGVSVESDIFTIGRTLMVLCAEFKGYQTTYEFTLPPVEQTPLFQQNDSLYRLLAKCCAKDPADRFSHADELRVQLLGVLRETVARRTPGTALTSAASVLFEPPTFLGEQLDWHQLPRLRPDTTDPQHSWLSNVDIEDPGERLLVLQEAPEESAEIRLARCQAALQVGDLRRVQSEAQLLLQADPWEWRAVWMTGLAALQAKDWAEAQQAFNAVYGQVPGELAPKLALAMACENGEEPEVAEALYATCVSTDANYVTPSAFGLARIRGRRGELEQAVAALDMVPATSRGYAESRRLRARHLLSLGNGLGDLDQAMRSIEGVRLEGRDADEFSVNILERALAEVRQSGPKPQVQIGAYPAQEESLREGLEEAYRSLARHDPERRVELIDRANRMRRWSWL